MLFAAAATPAAAHAMLRKAEPGVGSTVHASPPELTLTFSEGIEPTFSSVQVQDAGGHRVDGNDLHALHDTRQVAISLGKLPPGIYAVVWHATSVDTHKTEGRFNFTVAP